MTYATIGHFTSHQPKFGPNENKILELLDASVLFAKDATGQLNPGIQSIVIYEQPVPVIRTEYFF